MLNPQMNIQQIDHGWIIWYTGRDCLTKTKIFQKWTDVLKELDEYFGWYGYDDVLRKEVV